MFCSFNIKNYTLCKALVITEKFLPLWIFPIFIHLGSCPRRLEAELQVSVERSYSLNVSKPHFAEPTDVDNWDVSYKH